jgi:hypothetical protein
MVQPATQKVAVLLDWGHKDLKTGTLRAAVKQLGMDWADFENAWMSKTEAVQKKIWKQLH